MKLYQLLLSLLPSLASACLQYSADWIIQYQPGKPYIHMSIGFVDDGQWVCQNAFDHPVSSNTKIPIPCINPKYSAEIKTGILVLFGSFEFTFSSPSGNWTWEGPTPTCGQCQPGPYYCDSKYRIYGGNLLLTIVPV
jgi:hypothetical protein